MNPNYKLGSKNTYDLVLVRCVRPTQGRAVGLKEIGEMQRGPQCEMGIDKKISCFT